MALLFVGKQTILVLLLFSRHSGYTVDQTAEVYSAMNMLLMCGACAGLREDGASADMSYVEDWSGEGWSWLGCRLCWSY